jgi:dephospho-CoA kinase
MILGLTGTLGAGKGTVAEFLKRKGWLYFSLSDEVREEAKVNGIEITRENLQQLGNQLRAEQGNSILAQRALKKIKNPADNYVIDGIRNIAEVQELKMLPSFYLIAVDAPQQARFQRMLARNRESDPKNLFDFLKVDAIDQGQNQNESGQQVAQCYELADCKLINDSSIERFNDKITFMIQQLINKDALNGSAFKVV